jgi:hypothetical protein
MTPPKSALSVFGSRRAALRVESDDVDIARIQQHERAAVDY